MKIWLKNQNLDSKNIINTNCGQKLKFRKKNIF